MKPFDLEAAKRGEKIVTRDGHEAKFIAHVPEAIRAEQVVVLVRSEIKLNPVTGERNPQVAYTTDLFMAPKKRTVWVNLYADGWRQGYHYDTQLAADVGSQGKNRIGGKAYPVEIEE